MYALTKKIDWILVTAVFFLIGISVLALYGFSIAAPERTFDPFSRQLLFIAIGIAAFLFFTFMDYGVLRSYSTVLYFAMVSILLLTAVFGTTVRGTSGWIGVGAFHVQPVEFAKVVLIIFLAHFITKKRSELGEALAMGGSLVFTMIIIVMVLAQPDVGSAAVLGSIWGGMIILSGVRKRYIAGLLIGIAIAASIGWFFLEDYQKARLHSFVEPTRDPRGDSYNVIQSMIAVGSGGFFGKGVGHGSQSQLHFLPERHTDFIFASIAEETGVVGIVVLLGLFLVVLYRMKCIANAAQDNFGFFLVAGTMVMLFAHIMINIGMNMGLVPVTGIPLPLISYGGSSFLSTCIALGIIMSVYRRRRTILRSHMTESY